MLLRRARAPAADLPKVSSRPVADIRAWALRSRMMYPPSLPDDVKTRAFCATNGELGVLPADAPSFLEACRADRVEVYGWELWVVDHRRDFKTNALVPAIGIWDGGIPMRAYDVPAVVGGDGDVDEVEGQLASL